jgi:hypothetical protein
MYTIPGLTIPGLKKWGVTCASWVTRIANGLGLLDSSNIAYITTPRRVIDYSFFHHAHILKMRKKVVMMYKGYINEIELPDRTHGLYIVENFVLELQKPGWGVGRSLCSHDQEPKPEVLRRRCYSSRASLH